MTNAAVVSLNAAVKQQSAILAELVHVDSDIRKDLSALAVNLMLTLLTIALL